MSDLQFDTNPNEFGAPPRGESGTDITGKLVEWGLAADRQQAEYVLIAAGILALILAAFFFFSGDSTTPPPPPTL